MPLPAIPFARFVIGGPVNSQDVWAVTVAATKAAPPASQAEFDDTTLGVLTSFNSQFWSAASDPYKNLCAPMTKLATVRGYFYTAGALAFTSAQSISPVAGIATTTQSPITACVFTLRTTQAGRRGRGRIYLPLTGPGQTDGQLPVTTFHATRLATFLKAGPLGAWGTGSPSPAYPPCVVSETAGQAYTITSVKVDTIPDTQRGRRNRMTALGVFSATV